MQDRGSQTQGYAIAACLVLMVATAPGLRASEADLASFPTSGNVKAQAAFLRGLTALHHFEYEEAYESFHQVQQIDPGFVMAYWGEAMTYYQTLWRRENVAAARQALARLGSTRAVRAAKANSPKEQALLDAVEILFGDGAAPTRHRQYADAMARLNARYPEDPDIAALYALALMGNLSRGLIGFADIHDGRDQALAGSDTQRQVAALLERVLRSNPQHPGALHYLLHDYDDPEHARLALPAAQAYASIAGGFSHALHMPSHIFLQLGLWHDAARSDRAAYEASNEWIRRKKLAHTMRNYHALAWLQYELLQLGRYREAWETIGEIESVAKAGGALMQGGPNGAHNPLLSDLSSMRARYVIETGRWDVMAGERNFGNVDELFAIGVSAARAGDRQLAETARRALADRANAAQEGDLRPAIAIMEQEVAALIDLAAGRHEDAVATLRAAANAELQLPAPFGLPEPLKPAPELLGEVLFELGRPGDAVEHFNQTLGRNANRSSAVLGLARAAKARGQPDQAREHYSKLLANFDQADADLPVVKEARAAHEGRPAKSLLRVAIPVALAIVLSVAVVLRLVRRFATRAPLQARTRGRVARQRR